MAITVLRPFVVVAAVFGAVQLAACAGEEEEGFAPCDIRRTDCQQRTFRAVVALRGGDAPMPKISVVDEAGLMAFVTDGADEASEEETAAAERAYARRNRGLALFHLAPATYDSEQATQDQIGEIAGIYDPDSKEILIVDHGEPMDGEEAVLYLAHEFVHALQDAQHDLIAFEDQYGDSFDSSLAVASIVEGEAVLYQMLASAELDGLDTSRLPWQAFFDDFRREVLLEAEQDRAPLTMARLRFPYAFGGGFVTQHWLARGPAGVDALFAEPPLTTQAVMFGGEHGVVSIDQMRVREAGVPMLDEAFEEVTSTSLGSWMQRVFAARMGIPVARRNEIARALRADWFSVQADATEHVVAAWHERWSESSQGDWPGRNLASIGSRYEATHNDLYLIAGDPAEDIELSTLAWRMPTVAMEDEADMTAVLRQARLGWRRAIGCSGMQPRVTSEDDAHPSP